MFKLQLFAVVILAIAFTTATDVTTSDPLPDLSEKAGAEFLERLNKESSEKGNLVAKAEWQYECDLSPENLEYKLNLSTNVAKWRKAIWLETIKYPWHTYQNESIKRQFMIASLLGSSALPVDKYKRLETITSSMQSIFSTAKVCDYHNKTNCDLNLEPEIVEKFSKSRDPLELEYLWVAWHNATGRKCRKLYQEYVRLSNEGAKLNNMTDTGELWNFDFESDTFEDDVLELWSQVQPLYLQLHAYLRKQLWDKYGEGLVPRKGPIPAHLMGNMWAQTWTNIFDFTAPYPNMATLDVSQEMVNQNYTIKKMFLVAEDFFTSLNLSAMPPLFWERSILDKPKGKNMVCHGSAWDFFDGEDFRIKMCTRIEMNDLLTVHHEMGHIQYYLQYKHQPFVFKEGANSGFHEAVGDVIFLSAATRKHLLKLGLLKDQNLGDRQQEMNSLFLRALDKISFLPFALLIDIYRWNIFKGKTQPEHYNRDWWLLREKFQGVEPPIDRTEEDFDPASKYHIVAGIPYVRYFVSFIIQFQFHRALCIEAGEFDPKNASTNPLHECSIYNSTKAGNLLGKMLQMGSSRPWPEAMEVLTGQRKMDGTALNQFFQPLHDWLIKENERTGEKIGWDPSKKNFGQESGAAVPNYKGLTILMCLLLTYAFFKRY